VTVREDDVFDFLFRHPDGTQEGNETGAVIEAQQAALKPAQPESSSSP